MFSCKYNPQWITLALRTITSDHRNLQCIGIDTTGVLATLDYIFIHPREFRDSLREPACQGWLELDRLLVQLWESHSVHVEVYYSENASRSDRVTRRCAEDLLRETRKIGAVEMVYRDPYIR